MGLCPKPRACSRLVRQVPCLRLHRARLGRAGSGTGLARSLRDLASPLPSLGSLEGLRQGPASERTFGPPFAPQEAGEIPKDLSWLASCSASSQLGSPFGGKRPFGRSRPQRSNGSLGPFGTIGLDRLPGLPSFGPTA